MVYYIHTPVKEIFFLNLNVYRGLQIIRSLANLLIYHIWYILEKYFLAARLQAIVNPLFFFFKWTFKIQNKFHFVHNSRDTENFLIHNHKHQSQLMFELYSPKIFDKINPWFLIINDPSLWNVINKDLKIRLIKIGHSHSNSYSRYILFEVSIKIQVKFLNLLGLLFINTLQKFSGMLQLIIWIHTSCLITDI